MPDMIIRGGGATGQQVPYAIGRFDDADAYVVNQACGVSPFGGLLCCLGSSYAVDILPDGSGRSWFAGSEITLPDGSGKAWYIRDPETGETWSAFFGPVGEKLDDYEVRYSPGQVSARALRSKIACTLTVSTLPDQSCELWHVRLENRSARDRTLEFTTYAEPLAATPLEARYLERDRTLMLRPPLEAVGSGGPGKDLVYFQASTLTPVRFQTNRFDFIGDERSLRNPRHLEDRHSSGSDGAVSQAATSLTVEIELPIEGEAEFAFCFGIAGGAENALNVVRAFNTIDPAAEAVDTVKLHWRGLCSALQVESSDRVFDALVNTWLPYEAYAGWMRERNGSAYLDPSRVADLLRRIYAFAATAPDVCRDSLLSFAAGLSLLGAYSSDTGSLVELPPREVLWLPITTARYVAETGDAGVLELSIELKDGPSLVLREHCERAIRMCTNHGCSEAGVSGSLLDQVVRQWELITEGACGGSGTADLTSRGAEAPAHSADGTQLARRAGYLQSISPSLADRSVSRVLCEFAGLADESPGDAASAACLYAALMERVLGLTATSDGIQVRPTLPASWIECEVLRRFRTDVYRIRMRRSNSPTAGRGVSIVVDGEPILGEMLPLFGDGAEHQVDIVC